MHVHTESFARRVATRQVQAARKANRIAVSMRPEDNEAADVWREVARTNIREAKQRKQHARSIGAW